MNVFLEGLFINDIWRFSQPPSSHKTDNPFFLLCVTSFIKAPLLDWSTTDIHCKKINFAHFRNYNFLSKFQSQMPPCLLQFQHRVRIIHDQHARLFWRPEIPSHEGPEQSGLQEMSSKSQAKAGNPVNWGIEREGKKLGPENEGQASWGASKEGQRCHFQGSCAGFESLRSCFWPLCHRHLRHC